MYAYLGKQTNTIPAELEGIKKVPLQINWKPEKRSRSSAPLGALRVYNPGNNRGRVIDRMLK